MITLSIIQAFPVPVLIATFSALSVKISVNNYVSGVSWGCQKEVLEELFNQMRRWALKRFAPESLEHLKQKGHPKMPFVFALDQVHEGLNVCDSCYVLTTA